VQKLFIESSGAKLMHSKLKTASSNKLIASAISWQNSPYEKKYIRIKVRGDFFNSIVIMTVSNVLECQKTCLGLPLFDL